VSVYAHLAERPQPCAFDSQVELTLLPQRDCRRCVLGCHLLLRQAKCSENLARGPEAGPRRVPLFLGPVGPRRLHRITYLQRPPFQLPHRRRLRLVLRSVGPAITRAVPGLGVLRRRKAGWVTVRRRGSPVLTVRARWCVCRGPATAIQAGLRHVNFDIAPSHRCTRLRHGPGFSSSRPIHVQQFLSFRSRRNQIRHGPEPQFATRPHSLQLLDCRKP
jgi:hypothetical protein